MEESVNSSFNENMKRITMRNKLYKFDLRLVMYGSFYRVIFTKVTEDVNHSRCVKSYEKMHRTYAEALRYFEARAIAEKIR